ncbi:carnitine O-acetyltransferase-like isoform X2 [Drosophila hydei]|nr:carnitine O-acetyltransferase-like isoform X2 [Drosophila hydei]
MRLLKNGMVFWNLTKGSVNAKEASEALVKLVPPACFATKIPDSSGDKQISKQKQNLLQYPVLPLKETMDRFMATVQPLLTAEEFKKQQQITSDFKDNEGDKLQLLLEEAGKKECNWLADRWQKFAYLQYRDPVTIYVSPGMTFPPASFKDNTEFLNYTAKVIYGLCEFKGVVDAGKIPIVKMGKNELDNGQFGKVFGTCRIPVRITDELIYNPCSKHIVVIYKNHFYKLIPYDKDNKILSAPVLAQQLTSIMNAEKEHGIPFGIFTADTRDNWAEAYEALSKDPDNCKTLTEIQTSLFTVSLDEFVPYEPANRADELILSLIHGGGSKVNTGNRWMDKTIQLVVNPNGNVGFTYEHSPAEGQPIAMMMDYVVKKMEADKKYGECGSNVSQKPEKLKFSTTNPCIDQLLFYSTTYVDKLIKNLQMKVLKFECYGKGYIKSMRLGPDSFVQMALQLAFYKLHKVPAAQYESAHLRIFANGRTETIRSCSNESLAFCKVMTDSGTYLEERVKALRDAVSGHQAYAKQALQGRGVDRHLLGLKLMAEEHNLPIPKFFSSLGYMKSKHYRVSTSQVASVYEAFMGYGPNTADGYGCCYNPRESDIIVAISAWASNEETDPIKFAAALTSAFLEMKAVLDNEAMKSKL